MGITYIDKRGYRRYKENDRLVHRVMAYKFIYRKNKWQYKYKFADYDIHHINGDKLDNRVKNLQILTRKEHEAIHNKPHSEEDKKEEVNNAGNWLIIFSIILFLCLVPYLADRFV